MTVSLGIDIGASTVKLGLVDGEGRVLGQRLDNPSQAAGGPRQTMEVVSRAAAELCEANGLTLSELSVTGVCCPTPISRDGRCVYPTNIDISWKGAKIAEIVSQAIGTQAMLLNDGDAAAYREYWVRRSMGRASANMAQFITGTGLGGAIILDGEVLFGATVASELGHLPTESGASARACGCGARGCAETRASLIGLSNIVSDRRDSSWPQVLQGEAREVAKRLRRLVQQEEVLPEVNGIWEEYFTHLGRAARTVANTIGCDLIILSGGAQEREAEVSDRAYQRYLDQAISWLKAELRCGFPHLSEVNVEWALDHLPDSACYGVAAYALEQLQK